MDELESLAESWARTLRARNRSVKTQKSYQDTVRIFRQFLTDTSRPCTVAAVTRANIEDFIVDQLERWTPSTAATRYRCLQQFVKYLVEEDELQSNPMAGMSPPSIGEAPVPVFSEDELRRLVAAAEGKNAAGFEQRRDTAVVRVLIDTGARLGELAGMTVADVALDEQMVLVTGKGDRSRWLPFGNKTSVALDRYLRKRRGHPHAARDALWLGVKGPLTDSGLDQLLDRLAARAGVEGMHAHRFRHTFSHRFLAAGGQEGDLQHLAGWRSAQMLARYGASAKAERARQSHKRLGLGDSI